MVVLAVYTYTGRTGRTCGRIGAAECPGAEGKLDRLTDYTFEI